MNGASMIVLTFDMDWAPEWMMTEILAKLSVFGIKTTVFATGPLDIKEDDNVEVAIHPNFMNGTTQGRSVDEILDKLLGWFPGARGARTHCLYWYTNLGHALRDRGLLYDSSVLLPFHPHLEPVRIGTFTRIPYWWEENMFLDTGLSLDRLEMPGFDKPGLKIFDFHPIHVYLNTGSMNDYYRVTEKLAPMEERAPKEFERYINGGVGIGTFFDLLCNHVAEHQPETCRMKDLLP
jgi:hypothetical protein